MSVTFFVEQTPSGYQVTCECGELKSNMFNNVEHAYSELNDNRFNYLCGNHMCDVLYAFVDVQYVANLDVNVSNINARRLLGTLGFDTEDLSGSSEGDDFVGRVLLALALEPEDEGVPIVEQQGFVDCGRPHGYLQARLGELQTLGEYAFNNSLQIHWG